MSGLVVGLQNHKIILFLKKAILICIQMFALIKDSAFFTLCTIVSRLHVYVYLHVVNLIKATRDTIIYMYVLVD